jgi:ABC-type transport system involved in cytochrome c biogenesis permease subunit
VETIINALNILLPTFYVLTWAFYALLFFRNDPIAERVAPLLLYTSALLHVVDLVLRSVNYRHFPIATVFEAFSLLAFSILIVYIIIEWRTGVRTTGMFILGFVFIFQLVSSAFITPPTSFSELLWDPIFVLHVSTAVLGYSGMAISAIYGLLYLMLFYDIKKRRFGLIYKQLPSLEVMTGFTYGAAILGFAFLTVAMALGLTLLVKVYGTYWTWDPKVAATFVAWFIYSVGVGAGRLLGWSGRRVAFASIAGFLVILFSLVIINLFLTSFHEFV